MYSLAYLLSSLLGQYVKTIQWESEASCRLSLSGFLSFSTSFPIGFSLGYGLNSATSPLHTPQCICWIPNPQRSHIWRWCLWELIRLKWGHDDMGPLNEISALTGGNVRELVVCLSALWGPTFLNLLAIPFLSIFPLPLMPLPIFSFLSCWGSSQPIRTHSLKPRFPCLHLLG